MMNPERNPLEEEVRALRWRNAVLAQRVARLEQSVLFRFLRWAGSTAARILPQRGNRDAEYRRWLAAADRSAVLPQSPNSPSQTTAIWCNADPLTPAIREKVRAALAPQVAAILSPAAGETLATLAAPITTPWTVLLDGPAVLDANAVAAWIAASETADAAYGDWDHAAPSGEPAAPRFTPEFSPALLEHSPYWGPAFLIRTELLRTVASADPAAAARAATTANRVPAMLTRRYGAPEPSAAEAPPPSRTATVSLIICSRTPGLLDRCLAPLAGLPNTELLIVAHDPSSSGSLSPVIARHGAREIPYRRPFHYGVMNNLAARQATGDVLVLLNDDVSPDTPGWLDALAARLADPSIAIAGALLNYPSGRIQHAGVAIGRLPGPTHLGRGLRESYYWPWLNCSRDVAAVTGACLAIRRDVWRELDGFDPRFPVEYNDIDLCLRARARGYRVVLDARARLTHAESETRGRSGPPRELELFGTLWGGPQSQPDPYFHPELNVTSFGIGLRSPGA